MGKREAKSATYDCSRCHRKAWKPDIVARRGKDPGRAFTYQRFRHPKLYGRYRTCYVRIEALCP
ncbi:MAG TPA: hypothetical protein VGR56_02690 [Nitrososphaerales archaeon]|nr:hypothetical protein [Nitrososphaerales archaeon]